MPQIRVALAQVNPCAGDIDGNADQIVAQCKAAAEHGAHMIVFPEMMLTGYPIEDLALRASIIAASRARAEEVAARLASEGIGDLVAIVGFLDQAPGVPTGFGIPKNAPQNAVAVMHGGRIVARQAKIHLWNYGVGDEIRNFVAGDTINVVQIHGVDVAIAICEDLWRDGPTAAVRAAAAGLLVVPNGSPYDRAKIDARFELCARRAREAGATLAYVNLVGGQDELVFDGDSLVVDATGELIARAAQFEETLLVVDLDLPAATAPMPDEGTRFEGLRVRRTVITPEPVPAYETRPANVAERLDDLAEIYQAITLGLRDYVRKNGFRSVLLGLSGGIDSTLVGTIACDAIGPGNVYGVSNPSMYSTQHSKDDAAELARRTGLNIQTVPIASLVEAFHELIDLDGLAAENLQARIRAVIWMGLSNQHDHLVLACGNKSELATGYTTIYGDSVGGFAPIKDVPKTMVWELARWRNAEAKRRGEPPPIPEHAIAKQPSAELAPDQVDTDSLPPYALLDDVLDDYVEHDHGSAELIAHGFDPELVERVIRMVDRAEYKRRQYPPGPKISVRNFGRDRRVPITNAWRERL